MRRVSILGKLLGRLLILNKVLGKGGKCEYRVSHIVFVSTNVDVGFIFYDKLG